MATISVTAVNLIPINGWQMCASRPTRPDLPELIYDASYSEFSACLITTLRHYLTLCKKTESEKLFANEDNIYTSGIITNNLDDGTHDPFKWSQDEQREWYMDWQKTRNASKAHAYERLAFYLNQIEKNTCEYVMLFMYDYEHWVI